MDESKQGVRKPVSRGQKAAVIGGCLALCVVVAYLLGVWFG